MQERLLRRKPQQKELWGRFGGVLGPSWEHLGHSLGSFGRSWGALGALLGRPWGDLGRFGGALGTLLDALGAIVATLGPL